MCIRDRFIALSTNEFARAGDACELVYYSSTYIKCTNKSTGKVFTCNPTTSYVAVSYTHLDVYKRQIVYIA